MSSLAFLSEAKNIHQTLKELLKTSEPFDKEVDFQRKKSVFRFSLRNAGN
jgi:protein SMG7